MKVWTSYSSEHSSRIRIIGRFKSKDALGSFKDSFEQMKQLVSDNYDECFNESDKFPVEILDQLGNGTINHSGTIAAHDLLDFANEMTTEFGDDAVTIKSNESNWAGVIKMLIDAGAKVEMFSEHEYPVSNES